MHYLIFRTASSLVKIAHQFQVPPLMDYLVKHLIHHADEGNCLEFMRLCEYIDEESEFLLCA